MWVEFLLIIFWYLPLLLCNGDYIIISIIMSLIWFNAHCYPYPHVSLIKPCGFYVFLCSSILPPHINESLADTSFTSQNFKNITLFFVWFFFRATPMAYGHSQTRGQIRAVVAGLSHSHSNAGSELCLWPTPQIMAMPDP